MQKETYIHLKDLFCFLTEAPEPALMPPACSKEIIPIFVEKKAPILRNYVNDSNHVHNLRFPV